MRAARLLLVLAALSAPLRAAVAVDPADVPLDPADRALLTEKGYTFDAAGGLHEPGGAAVAREDAAFLLEDLRSRRRLADLIEIQLAESRADEAGAMSPADKQALRQLSQRDWPLLTKSDRDLLKPLFSEAELRGLDARLPAAPPPSVGDIMASAPAGPMATLAAPALPLAVQPPAAPAPPLPAHVPTAAEVFASAPARPAAAPAAAPATPPALPSDAELADATSVVPPGSVPPPTLAALPTAAPAAPAPAPAVAPPAPAAPVLAVPAPAVAVTTPPAAGQFHVEPAAPPKVSTAPGLTPLALPAQPGSPAPAAAPTPAAPAPAYPAFSKDAFDVFLATAPYGQAEKELLLYVSQRLPEPERRRAFGVLMARVPHVTLDSTHAGVGARSALGTLETPGLPPRDIVAVNDGPVLVERPALFGAGRAWELPDAPAFYAARGLKRPPAQAFERTSGSSSEADTRWGRARVYPDGSRRLVRGREALAGALTRALLLLDARERLPGDPYSAALLAATGEFQLYRALEKAAGHEPPLDRDRLALYREWRDRPLDYVDTMEQALLARGDAAARILSEAGLGSPKPAPPEPLALPVKDSAASEAWLDAERAARAEAK